VAGCYEVVEVSVKAEKSRWAMTAVKTICRMKSICTMAKAMPGRNDACLNAILAGSKEDLQQARDWSLF